MNRYLKLVNFEFNRFFKFFLILAGITVLSQIIGIIVESRSYIQIANDIIYGELMPKSEFIQSYGTFSLYTFIHSTWFQGPIALCIVSIAIYIFFIWYRDWYGKNTFIYRLLMLPTARIHIYLAKATVILLNALGLVALQLILLPIENQIVRWIIPEEFLTVMPVKELLSSFVLTLFYPFTFTEFLIRYGTGMIVVMVIFTAILFERSFRLKGILFAPSMLQSRSPIIGTGINKHLSLDQYFYPFETFFMYIICALLVLPVHRTDIIY